MIKVGSVWAKKKGHWARESEGKLVVVVSVKGTDIQYRYITLSNAHGYSGGWTIGSFLNDFELVEDL